MIRPLDLHRCSIVIPVVLLLSAFACTRTPAPLAARNYDQSCANDEGCALIHTGDPCVGGFQICPGDAAISRRDLARYEADLRERPKCPDMPPAVYACRYENVSAVCVEGRCGARGTSWLEPDAGPTTRF